MGHKQDCTWTNSAISGEERATSVLASFLLPGADQEGSWLLYLMDATDWTEFLSALCSLYWNFFLWLLLLVQFNCCFSFNIFDTHVVIQFSMSLHFVYIVCSQIQLCHVKLFHSYFIEFLRSSPCNSWNAKYVEKK